MKLRLFNDGYDDADFILKGDDGRRSCMLCGDGIYNRFGIETHVPEIDVTIVPSNFLQWVFAKLTGKSKRVVLEAKPAGCGARVYFPDEDGHEYLIGRTARYLNLPDGEYYVTVTEVKS